MLVASQLTFSHAGHQIFHELDLSVSAGKLVQVTGVNGSDKTTLLQMLYGLLALTNDLLTWHGAPVRNDDAAFLNMFCYVGHTNDIDPDLTVTESLRLAVQLAGLPVSATEPLDIGLALEVLELGKFAATPVRKLSQDQRRRMVLTRLLLARRELWLPDEPIVSFDDHAVSPFTIQLDTHLRAGDVAIMVTRYLLSRPRRANRVLRLGGIA